MFSADNRLHLATTASTNQVASDLIISDVPPEGFLVIADEQTEGRGQQGNRWETEPGKNLTFSFILYPTFLNARYPFDLNIAVSLGISDTLRVYCGEDLTIKWPNDIFNNDKKLGGVLIENTMHGNRIASSVVGIGINVNQILFSEAIGNPTSLTLILKRKITVEPLLNDLLGNIERRYFQLKTGMTDALREEYISRLYLYHTWHLFSTDEGKFKARIQGVSLEGRLILEFENGSTGEYGFKEIAFRKPLNTSASLSASIPMKLRSGFSAIIFRNGLRSASSTTCTSQPLSRGSKFVVSVNAKGALPALAITSCDDGVFES